MNDTNYEDFELTLFDRLNVIKDTINKYGEDNFYLSFSGGKDSTVLHYMIDEILPNNKIARVYVNTGIEYNDMVEFVKDLASKDNRFVIIQPKKPIKQVLEKYGYPFKSKEYSHKLNAFKKSDNLSWADKYFSLENVGKPFCVPRTLYYQASDDWNPFVISDQCCYKLKKTLYINMKKRAIRP